MLSFSSESDSQFIKSKGDFTQGSMILLLLLLLLLLVLLLLMLPLPRAEIHQGKLRILFSGSSGTIMADELDERRFLRIDSTSSEGKVTLRDAAVARFEILTFG